MDLIFPSGGDDLFANSHNDIFKCQTEVKIERSFDSLQDYYKIDKISNSRMVQFRRSPRHYLYSLTHFEETPAMILGRAFHCIVLEEEKFDDNFYLIDESLRPDLDHGMTSKLNKNWKYHQSVKNGRKSLISQNDYDTIRYMKDALFKDGLASDLFSEVHSVEYEIYWTDPETGVPIKMKLDAVADDFTLDLKSCANAQPDAFWWHAKSFEYHGQAALYRNGRPLGRNKQGHKTNLNKGSFYFIAVEKEPPYGVSVNKCLPRYLQWGEELYSKTLENFEYWKNIGSPDIGYSFQKTFGYSVMDAPYSFD